MLILSTYANSHNTPQFGDFTVIQINQDIAESHLVEKIVTIDVDIRFKIAKDYHDAENVVRISNKK